MAHRASDTRGIALSAKSSSSAIRRLTAFPCAGSISGSISEWPVIHGSNGRDQL